MVHFRFIEQYANRAGANNRVAGVILIFSGTFTFMNYFIQYIV